MIFSHPSLKRIATLMTGAAIIAIGLSACNTVEGVGQDVKSTGKAIEKTADKNK